MEKTETVKSKDVSEEDFGKEIVVTAESKPISMLGEKGELVGNGDDFMTYRVRFANGTEGDFHYRDIELVEPKEVLQFIREDGIEDVYDHGGYEHRSVKQQLEVIEKNIKHLQEYKKKLEEASSGDKSKMVVYPYDTNYPVVVEIHDVVMTKYGNEGLVIGFDHDNDTVTLKYLDGKEETLESHRIA